LITVNDGITDNSLTVAKQFESEKIRVFSQGNKGLCFANNLWVERNMETKLITSNGKVLVVCLRG